MMLTAGAPRAVDHDEDRLLLALRRIVDRCPVPLRAGAQRGRVFAAPLGHAERRSYTVLGDPVNVAARALGLASDGDVVVGDGMGVAERSARVGGRRSGRSSSATAAEPMPMWRVDGSYPTAPSPRGSPTSVGGVRADEWDVTHVGLEAHRRRRRWMQRGDRSDPGMGASQLIDELADLVGPTATLVVAHPVPAVGPYGAVADTARQLARAGGARARPTRSTGCSRTPTGSPPDLHDWATLVRGI
jgi:hypothetical protein